MATLWLATALSLAQPVASLDVVVLLDESGSMYGNPRKGTPGQDPQFMRYAALQCLARKLRPGDQIATIPFGSVALRAGTVGPFDPYRSKLDWSALIPIAREGEQAQRATNYVDALAAAQELLGPPRDNRFRFVLFCTDGEPNARGNSPDEVVLASRAFVEATGARVYTLSLGRAGTQVLQRMANATGGRSFEAKTASDLPFQFANLLRDATEREVKASHDQATFLLGRSARELRAVAVSSSDGPVFSLVGPDGVRRTPGVDEAVYAEGQQGRVHWLRIAEPPPGRWRVEGDPASVDVAFESSLRIDAVTPAEGDTIRSRGDLVVTAQVRGAEPTDTLEGTATLSHGSGSVTAPLTLSGTSAHTTLELDGIAPGPAVLRLTVRRPFEGSFEEGVPTSVGLTVIEAPPGKPVVRVEWPAKPSYVTWSNESVRLPVRLVATREARGKAIRFEGAPGWVVTPQTPVVLDKGEATAILEVRGPYDGKRGDFASTLRALPSDTALQVVGDHVDIRVRAKTWLDRLLAFMSVGLPFFLLLGLFVALIAMSAYGWRTTKRLRTTALGRVQILCDGQVVSGPFAKPSAKRRTFGGPDSDSSLDLNFKEEQGDLLTATLGRTLDHIMLSGNRLKNIEGNEEGRLIARSGRPIDIEVYDEQGYPHRLTVSYDHDERGIRRRKWSMTAIWTLLMLTLLSFAWAWSAGQEHLDRSTYVQESTGGPANERE